MIEKITLCPVCSEPYENVTSPFFCLRCGVIIAYADSMPLAVTIEDAFSQFLKNNNLEREPPSVISKMRKAFDAGILASGNHIRDTYHQTNKEKNMDGLIEGRTVHFVMPDGKHTPAIIVKVWNQESGMSNLQVFTDGSNALPYTPEEKVQFSNFGIDLQQVAHGHVG